MAVKFFLENCQFIQKKTPEDIFPIRHLLQNQIHLQISGKTSQDKYEVM